MKTLAVTTLVFALMTAGFALDITVNMSNSSFEQTAPTQLGQLS